LQRKLLEKGLNKNIDRLFVVALFGNITGDNLGYFLSRRYWEELLRSIFPVAIPASQEKFIYL